MRSGNACAKPNQNWQSGYTSEYSYDEMLTAEGIRSNWQIFLNGLNQLDLQDLQKLKADTQRRRRENGVIYNIVDENATEGVPRSTEAWELDLLPMLFTAADWQTIEAGLVQRARLLDATLRDIYGEQALIKNGIVPAKVIYAHSKFLRPAVGTFFNPVVLPLFACDYTRDRDGRIQVIRDFAQAPNGMGHTLENRLLLANVWPDAFRELKVTRVADFFRQLKQTLQHMSPRNKENPNVVVLTAGPESQTYFEQAYLASYLGYHLVQGDDLTVQDGQVWLKSVKGLQKVDVIMRQFDDSACDPVELDPSALAGIPGLLQAVRQKDVAIANPIGSGVIENPGLYPFLNAICQFFFNENLLIPTIDTWWCGQNEVKQHVIANLNSLVIKSIDKHRPTRVGKDLSPEETQALIQEIEREPYKFVGQMYNELSTTPVFREDGLEANPVNLRSFAVATGMSQFIVMPGGIASVVNVPNQADQSSLSKDMWVSQAPESPEENTDAIPKGKRVFNASRIRELESVLPSRAAESLYWAGRYAERIESSARLLRCAISDMNDYYQHQDSQNQIFLNILLECLGAQGSERFIETVDPERKINVKQTFSRLRGYLSDPAKIGSLVQTTKLFTSSAFAVRDLWSSDTWRTIDALNELRSQLIALPINRFTWQENIDEVILLVMSFLGLVSESMMLGDSWRMLEIGRKVERILLQTRNLNLLFGEARDENTESMLCEAALKMNESLIAHRRMYRHVPDIESALELLVVEHRNPRSLVYQIDSLRKHVDKLPKSSSRIRDNEAQRIALRCDTDIKLISLSSLYQLEESERKRLKQFMASVYQLTDELGEVLAHTYFSHTQMSHQLTDQEYSVIKLV